MRPNEEPGVLALPKPAATLGYVRGPWGATVSVAWVVLAFTAEQPLRHAVMTAAGLPLWTGGSGVLRAAESLATWGTILLIIALAVRLTDVTLRDYFGWTRPRARDVLGAAGFVLGLYGAVLLITLASGDAGVHVAYHRRTFAGASPVVILLAWWSTVLLAPLVEESVFRGFLWRGVENRAGPAAALLVTTVLFAVFHWGYWTRGGSVDGATVMQYLVMGGVLGGLRLASGGTVAPMVAHALANAALAGFPAALAALSA